MSIFSPAEVAAKRLDLLHELVPGAARIGVLVNPNNNTSTEATLRDATAAARAIGLQIRVFNARTGGEINTAFDAIEHEPPDALFVAGDAFFSSRRVQIVNLASRHGIPTTFSQREFTDAGGLMSYGPNIADTFRQIGLYVGQTLKGAKPGDLPVIQSSKFELIVNAETTRMLHLIVPPSLLARADEVIEYRQAPRERTKRPARPDSTLRMPELREVRKRRDLHDQNEWLNGTALDLLGEPPKKRTPDRGECAWKGNRAPSNAPREADTGCRQRSRRRPDESSGLAAITCRPHNRRGTPPNAMIKFAGTAEVLKHERAEPVYPKVHRPESADIASAASCSKARATPKSCVV